MSDFEIKKIKTKTLKDRIYDIVKESVLKSEFPVESYITEIELSEKLNVSRTPLREAMQDLISEDLIEFKPRKGYKQRIHSKDEINQIFRLRYIIEKEIVSPLLENINQKDLKFLKEVVEQQEEACLNNDQFLFMNLDKKFHREMFMISKFNVFLKAYDIYHNLTILIGAKAIRQPGRMQKVINEHKTIIENIEKKNSELLVNSIKTHLNNTQTIFTSEEYNN